MKRYIKRIASSNHRVIQGKIYIFDTEMRIITDEKGGTLSPTFNVGDKVYWIYVELNENENENETGEKKMSKLLTIETTVLINGQRVDEFTTDTLIGYIQKEESNIEKLKEIKVKSKAIEGLKEKHTDNIKALVEILDSREE